MDRSHVEIFNYFICYTCLNYRRTDKIYNNYYSDSATRPAFGRPVPRFYALCPSKHSLKLGWQVCLWLFANIAGHSFTQSGLKWALYASFFPAFPAHMVTHVV